MRHKIAFIDADETLFDFKAAEKTAIGQALARFGEPCPDSVYRLYHDINDALWKRFERKEIAQEGLRRRRFVELFEQTGLALDPDEFAPVFIEELAKGSKLLPGAIELLDALKGKIRLCLATNGISEVQRGRIARSGLDAYFDSIFISHELGSQKPDREYFDAAFALLGEPDRAGCIILGDSLTSDMQGGKNAGIATCWFNPEKKENPTPHLCDFTIDKLSNFPAIALG